MATIKNNWLRTSTLILLGLVMAFGAQSFNNKEEVKVEKKPAKVVTNQTWYFIGTSSDDPTDASKYSTSLPSGKSCNSAPFQTVCEIQAPANPSNSSQPDMNHLVSSSQTVEQRIEEAIQSLEPTETPLENETVTAFRKN